ncbi:MAG: phosphoribosylamine--glycine ligase [Patescibacteria group bacterium]|jgi:phosphoribosylamine--glycine ligase
MRTGKRILVVGSGGREFAIVWLLITQSLEDIDTIFIAPGNAGTLRLPKCVNIKIKAHEVDALLDLAQRQNIDLVIVGPEDPLGLGIIDKFQAAGIKAFGPPAVAAEIELSKAFAKGLMEKHDIPTAPFRVFDDYQTALDYVHTVDYPCVIKVSGPALGKGALVCRTLAEAEAALKIIMVDRSFGNAGNQVVIEKFLEGKEFSAMVIVSDDNFTVLPIVQDYKYSGEGDTGTMTGGLGVCGPLAWTDPLMDDVNTIVQQLLLAMKAEGRQFGGCFYVGFMQTEEGLMVLEVNARFGDPEMQAIARLLITPFLDIVLACVNGTLGELDIQFSDQYVAGVVIASDGYPGTYEKDKLITGIEAAEAIESVVVMQAGTAYNNEQQLITNGGRVLIVTAIGRTLQEALSRALRAAALISFDGAYYRPDIGSNAL